MVTRARKIYFTLLAVLWLATGCSFDSGRVQLLNWNWFGTPDKVTVQRGDTLYSISKRYNVPLRDLIEINNLTPPYTLIIGRQLRLPTAKFHTVAKGDTLYNISKRYGVDVTTLSRVNHLQAPYTLSIGQRLALPGSVSGGEVHTPAPVKRPRRVPASVSGKARRKRPLPPAPKKLPHAKRQPSANIARANSPGRSKARLFHITAPSEKDATMTA